MGFLKVVKKAAKGDMLGAATELLPDSIKETSSKIFSKTAEDYLETGDLKSVGKNLLNNTATEMAGKEVKTPSTSHPLPKPPKSPTPPPPPVSKLK